PSQTNVTLPDPSHKSACTAGLLPRGRAVTALSVPDTTAISLSCVLAIGVALTLATSACNSAAWSVSVVGRPLGRGRGLAAATACQAFTRSAGLADVPADLSW